MSFFGRSKRRGITREIAPDEIFLDSSNLPGHNEVQFEGRVERPVTANTILGVGVVFFLVMGGFAIRAYDLQIVHGEAYADASRNNRLDRSLIFAVRGTLFDRNGRALAWNEAPVKKTNAESLRLASTTAILEASQFALRKYIDLPGLAHVLGFVRYPKADSNGTWWREDYTGISGGELAFDSTLHGTNGSIMVETDARGNVERENLVTPPVDGTDVKLSVDAELQSKLYELLLQHADEQRFKGGASVIMDVRTGELLALTSFPEYDNSAFTDGNSAVIKKTYTDPRTPLLNRAVSGVYTPGSIVKPIFAAAALNEKIISPDTQILSTGALSLPNPYDPEHPSIFRDWTVHGLVDMRTALAVSSDEYFYTIGGGYKSQKGLGINLLDEYARKFGLASLTGIPLLGESAGVIPTPAWKEQIFGVDDPWRIGDTYHTAIGQYGFQMTTLQAVRFISAIANGGKLMKPHLILGATPESTDVGIPDSYLQIVREGMRMAVTSTRKDATVKALNIGGIHIAAKTGTAELGLHNEAMNSWSVGFWPAENPHYAYATVLERAPAGTLSGAAPAMLPFFYWLIENKPQYLE